MSSKDVQVEVGSARASRESSASPAHPIGERSAAAFTPGPWVRNIPPATKYTTVWAGRNSHVAYVATRGLDPGEVEANIRLIAAAPDLYEALKRSAEGWANAIELRLIPRQHIMSATILRDEAKAALAKAGAA